jgi:isopropylmalate/homocitrate/citramalate synthase
MKLVDVTLREGQQRPGRSYSINQKIAAARRLNDLGVDYVQVGFPVADDGTREVCSELDLDAKTTGIARVLEEDIDAAESADVDVIGLFAPTSDVGRERLLGVSKEELEDLIFSAVDRARETGREVRFGAMHGFDTDPAFLEMLANELDVEYMNITDTVGSCTPRSIVDTIHALDCERGKLGVHFHDDLGLATANALTAATLGVGKVDVSVAGLGERAGNTPFEEFVVSTEVGDFGFETNVHTSRLIPECNEILSILEERAHSQKPVLGENVHRHESGLHTAAMLDYPSLFEPYPPEQFGGIRELQFGEASGRGAARRLLERAGYPQTDENVARLLAILEESDGSLSFDTVMELITAEFADEE